MKTSKKRTPPPTDPATAMKLLAWIATAGVTSVEQARLLFAAADSEATVSDLARRCSMPMSTASRIIWQLTESGLLSMHGVSGDRRKKIVRAEFLPRAA